MSDNGNTLAVSPALLDFDKSTLEIAFARISAIYPDMGNAHRYEIALRCLANGTIPGRDVHYWVKDSKLHEVSDYKWLVWWAEQKEAQRTGNPRATIEIADTDLDADERKREGLGPDVVAVVAVTISNADERARYRCEIGEWKLDGFTLDEARQMVPFPGTRAVGVVTKSDAIPKGWSPREKAVKLAVKAAIRKRYGNPAPAEIRQMIANIAKVEVEAETITIEQWIDGTDEPPEAEARRLRLEARARQQKVADEGMTLSDHHERLRRNVALLRGDNEPGIGDDPPIEKPQHQNTMDFVFWLEDVFKEIPYFSNRDQVYKALADGGFDEPDLSRTDEMMQILHIHANQQADNEL